MRLIEQFWKNERGMVLGDVAKAGVAIALLSVVAANLVSRQTAPLDKERLGQVASAAAKGQTVDPLVTGSLQKRANEIKLDPCVVPR